MRVVSRRIAKVWIIAGVLITALSTFLALQPAISGVELAVFAAINGWQAPALIEIVARFFSDFVWGLVFALILAFLFWSTKRLYAWRIGVAVGASAVIAYVIEHIVGRGRPEDVLSSADVILRASQDGYGFPSNHEAAIVVAGLVLWRYLNIPAKMVALALMILVGWSRIFLGVHMPLDIIGAVGIGLIVAGVAHLIPPIDWRVLVGKIILARK